MSFKLKLLYLLLFILSLQKSYAQQNNDPIIEYITESVADNLSEDFDYTELVERLNYYRRNNINLNKTNRQQ